MSSITRTTSMPWVFFIAVPALLLSACSHAQPEPRAVPPAPDSTPATTATDNSARDHSVTISEELRQTCDLPSSREDSPLFDFDDSRLRPRGMGLLDDLATCLRDGSLKGQGVTVVGHADRRGAKAYNQALGMRRAEAARDYLTSRGVVLSAITAKSLGEQAATGTNLEGWQLDRRVEIEASTLSLR